MKRSRPPTSLRRFVRWTGVVLCLALILYFTSPLWLTALGSYLVRDGPPAHAQMAVVLAGDAMGNRVLKGGELAKGGYIPHVLVSGPPVCCYGIQESELAISFAGRHGYPASYFFAFNHDGLSTLEEGRRIVAELRQRRVQSIDLITSNYHTRRAGRIFRSLAPDLELHVVAAPDPYFTPDTWWKTREGQKMFAFEWAKIVANWFGM